MTFGDMVDAAGGPGALVGIFSVAIAGAVIVTIIGLAITAHSTNET